METVFLLNYNMGTGQERVGMYVCVLPVQKEGFRLQVLAVSSTGDQQGLGPLPKGAEIKQHLVARTFSQFISFKIGSVPSGHMPTSILWSQLIQPGFHFPNRIQISTAPKSRFETSIKLAIITLLIVVRFRIAQFNNVHDKTSLPLHYQLFPGMSTNNRCKKQTRVA